MRVKFQRVALLLVLFTGCESTPSDESAGDGGGHPRGRTGAADDDVDSQDDDVVLDDADTGPANPRPGRNNPDEPDSVPPSGDADASVGEEPDVGAVDDGGQSVGDAETPTEPVNTDPRPPADTVTDPEPECSESCDDGISCTVDSCRIGGCFQSIGPNEGGTACPPGYYCTLEDGCVDAPACAVADDCESAFAEDPCKTNPRCDPASSVCLFDLLDKDGDGHAPQVCGGDDCDDNDRGIHPGPKTVIDEQNGAAWLSTEACNGRDDDCDGMIDEQERDPDLPCGTIAACVDGECVCGPENQCDDLCVDFTWDWHCGGCGIQCGSNGVCVDGACTCPGVAGDLCPAPEGFECVVLADDEENCGECGNRCDSRDTCVSGRCERHCPFPGPNGEEIRCGSNQICTYLQGGTVMCVRDPCPEDVLDCTGCARDACPDPTERCNGQGESAISCN